MKDLRCRDCDEYDPDGVSINGLGSNRNVKGCCRMDGPVTVVIQGVQGQSDTEVRSGFPHVEPDEWCSLRPREEEED
jgi:hypothetical protein